MQKLFFGALLVFCVGLGSTGLLAQGARDADAAIVFQALEQRLLDADNVRLDFHVSAEGVIEAELRGSLEIDAARRTQLTASGDFAGRPVALRFSADGEQYELDNGTQQATSSRPEYLEEALVIGLTRMGVLHNLAGLVGAAPPDHADGGVLEWVVVSNFMAGGGDTTSFDIAVGGEPAGSASLEIDSRGRPVVRRQSVQFESGEMWVVERYSAVTIAP